MRYGQKLFRYGRVRRFTLPEDADDPPSIAVEEKLKTINPARKGLGVYWVVARFVGAEDLHDVAVAVGVARYFFFEESIFLEVSIAKGDELLEREGVSREICAVFCVANRP